MCLLTITIYIHARWGNTASYELLICSESRQANTILLLLVVRSKAFKLAFVLSFLQRFHFMIMSCNTRKIYAYNFSHIFSRYDS